MAGGIYKPGQGYWTRLMSAIGLGLIVLMGVAWLMRILRTVQVGDIPTVFIQAGVALVVLGVFGVIGYRLLGTNPRVVEFMIATEGEMKKVNWSNRREVLGSTWLVIGLTVLIAILCLTFDLAFQFLFQKIGVLEI